MTVAQHTALWCAVLLLPLAAAEPASDWLWPHRGDVRAAITLTHAELAAASGGPVVTVIEWRRRDDNPGDKRILVTDHTGQILPNVSTPVITQHEGVVVFTPTASSGSGSSYSSAGASAVAGAGAGPGTGGEASQTYYVYYMPYTQSGVGAAHLAWDPPGAGPNDWSLVANVSTVQKADHSRQVFALPKPVTARLFRWTCVQSWSGNADWQAFLVELEFRTPSGWLPNHATSAQPAPITSASSWQPDQGGDGWKPSGQAFAAMDGDNRTLWDPKVTPASLELDFGEEITVEAIGVMGYGDTTHDIKAFTLETAPTPAPRPSHRPWQQLPRASGVRIESRDEFHNINPMGLPANTSELAGMVAKHPSADGVWVFPERRENKVMMEDRVPYRWVEKGPSQHFSASVQRGEWFYFQLGLYTTDALSSVTLSSLAVAGGGVTVQARCLNTEGSTSLGEDVSPTQRPDRPGFDSFLVSAEAGTVTSLWIGVEIPTTVKPNTVLRGAAMLGLQKAAGTTATTKHVSVALTVSAEPVSVDQGFSNLSSYSRLSWLNSKYAIDDEVVAPYTALQVGGGGGGAGFSTESSGGGFFVGLLNRQVRVGADGLPSTITVTRPASAHGVIAERKINLLAKPISLALLKGGAALPVTVRTPATVWRTTPAMVSWSSVVVVGPAVLTLNATIHMDGYMDFAVALSAATPADEHFEVDDIQLRVEWSPQPKDRLYYSGMDQLGQAFESNTSVAWKWSMARKNNFIWAGSPSAGLRLELKDDNDPHRDAAIPGYSQLPLSWAGKTNQGGCNFSAVAGSPLGASLTAYTGAYTLMRAVKAPLTNGSRVFRFDMSVTPFKARNESQHWNLRHFQVGYPDSTFTSAEDVHKTGATVINIHQGVDTMINPFINYPFIPESVALLDNYTKTANALGMRVKFYYTVRELSNHAAEIWAMRQLGNEIYARPSCGFGGNSSSCGGAAWLQEQLGTSYQPAWFDQLAKPNGADAAIAQAGTAGRWLNYYIEGLRQSVAESPYINGIYYDGILFDRFTMVRVRKTLERNSKVHEPLIDMHTGNDFTQLEGRRTDAVQYANHWAYVDSLWIGEGFSYDSPPDNWLLEISGMPFGVFSDMLGTPNKYRGMLFGSTGRFGCANPTPMWEFWDKFGMQDTDMVGWWEPEVPVTVAATGADGPIHATAYVSKGKKTLISIGSWSSSNATVKLTFDWATLGLLGSAVKSLTAPAIPSFQTAQSWGVGDSIPVEPKKGWLLVVEPAVAEAVMRPSKSDDETRYVDPA